MGTVEQMAYSLNKMGEYINMYNNYYNEETAMYKGKKINPKGEFTHGLTYNPGDAIWHNNELYIANKATSLPPTLTSGGVWSNVTSKLGLAIGNNSIAFGSNAIAIGNGIHQAVLGDNDNSTKKEKKVDKCDKDNVLATILCDAKNFISSNRKLIYIVALLWIVDTFFFDGKFKTRLTNITENIVKKIEEKTGVDINRDGVVEGK